MARSRLLAVLATAMIGFSASAAPLAALEVPGVSDDVSAPVEIAVQRVEEQLAPVGPALEGDGILTAGGLETPLDQHPLVNLVRALALALVLATTSLTGLIGQRLGLAHRPR
ncbi:MAG: hypothetical protein KY469_19710 [Actinobacteria bacterium]|nr:hypothetical protein [Actinomycetota bacterium]